MSDCQKGKRSKLRGGKKCVGPLNPLDVASVEGLAAVCAHVHVHIRAILPACLCVYASMISRRNQRWEHRSRDLDNKVLVPISCAQAPLGPGTWLPALWPESCYCAELMESSNLVSKTCPGRPKASIDSIPKSDSASVIVVKAGTQIPATSYMSSSQNPLPGVHFYTKVIGGFRFSLIYYQVLSTFHLMVLAVIDLWLDPWFHKRLQISNL